MRSICLKKVSPKGNLRNEAQVYMEVRSGLQVWAGTQVTHLKDLAPECCPEGNFGRGAQTRVPIPGFSQTN